MLQRTIRHIARTSQVCASRMMPAVASASVAPVRLFTSSSFRTMGAPASSSHSSASHSSSASSAAPRVEISTREDRPFTPEERKAYDMPDDLKTYTDVDGTRWVDYRPENLRNLNAVRNSEGDLVGKFEGEEVIFPDLEPTLEWVLTTPVEAHLFEEAPIIKIYESESTH